MTNIEQKIIKPKVGLLELAKQLGSVSQACKTMGYSRDSFYRFYRKPSIRSIKSLSSTFKTGCHCFSWRSSLDRVTQ